MLLLGPILLCLSIGQATAQSLASASAPPTVTNPSTGVSLQGTLSSGIESFYNIRFGEDTADPIVLPSPKLSNTLEKPSSMHLHSEMIVHKR